MSAAQLQCLLAMAADHLWQASLFALVAWAAVALLRNAPARTRSAIWILASIKFALPLALFAWLGAQTGIHFGSQAASAQAAVATPVTVILAPAAVPAAGADVAATATNGLVWVPLAIAAVWLAGFAVSIGSWLAGRRKLTRAIRAGNTIYEGRERSALERARQRLGVETPVGVMTSPDVHEPGVWCVLRPIVVLPEGIATELSDEELEAVMMHEVAHVARHDNLVANAHMLLCCLFWFHPMVWWIDRQLLAERERACDEAVLEAGGASRIYAAGLLKVFRFTIGWRPAGVSCATGSHFGRRIQVIMGDTNDRIATTWHRAVTAGVTILLAGLSLSAAAFNGGNPQQQHIQEERDVVLQSAEGPGSGPGLAKTAAAAPTLRDVQFANTPGAPVAFTGAELKKIPAAELAKAIAGDGQMRKVVIKNDDQPGAPGPDEKMLERRPFPETDADGNATVLLMTIQNVSARTVTGYQFSGQIGPEDNIFFVFNRPLAPGETFSIAVPVGRPLLESPNAVLSVKGAKYDDNSTWGEWKQPDMELMKHRAQ